MCIRDSPSPVPASRPTSADLVRSISSQLDGSPRQDRLSRAELAWLAPYLPNLGTAWMSAAAMTARADAATPAAAADAAAANAAAADTGMIRRSPPEADEPYTLVNQLLAGNFAVMEGLPREEAAFSDNLGASRRISPHLGASRRISSRRSSSSAT